ncbi:GvpL/GvpF family gas vesicle protein [Planktothrix sp. FACHB-1365]|uniref:gas vesicle protein GvpF n=1 Tax=Planktothrix sp. FACHB-1365 TaxID=2692855 RepID=UPI001685EFFB|nr:GvpL/GvpF family gas vesicle protein [Planktothrix sp. FACHB-1365]MBD2481565.1 GvpL/GvpF family gas vesicle protein [Planktothrix sp. FACHB-1365]
MATGLYLYGIFADQIPDEMVWEGIDHELVHSEVIEGFSFLYSVVHKEKYLASRRYLICHEKVLENVMEAGFHTLLPLRFGLVVKTWETVIEQLIIPYQNQLKELFTKLSGKREVSIKIFWDSPSELKRILECNQELKKQRDDMLGKTLTMEEIIYIGQRIENSLYQCKQEIVQVFRDQLNHCAQEVVENEPMMDDMIYNTAYLIPWDQESEFSQKVEAIDQQFGDRLRIRYNNLTAPYTFAQLM